MANKIIANQNRLSTKAAGRRHTVDLKSDGTVMAVGDNKCGHRYRTKGDCTDAAITFRSNIVLSYINL